MLPALWVYCMEEKSQFQHNSSWLKKIKFGRRRVLEAIEVAGKQEISKLEKGLSTTRL